LYQLKYLEYLSPNISLFRGALVTNYVIGIEICANSSKCGSGSFCNFDFEESGFCEPCPQKSYIICEAQDLIVARGKEECYKMCEGRYNFNCLLTINVDNL
jgi:hypothetical protein